MAEDRYQPENYQIAIFGYAFLAFAALLCQQRGGQFCHGIGCNICPELPALDLDDTKWEGLEGGYKGTKYNASGALKKLELANGKVEISFIYKELWDELHHQGDIGLASYYAVPHLVRIAQEKKYLDYNVLGLVSVIEIQRHKDNPPLPKALYPAYNDAITNLGKLAVLAINQPWNLDLASSALTAIALAKGQIKLANAIQNMDSEGVIDEFLESY